MVDGWISVIELVEKMASRVRVTIPPMRTAGDIMHREVKTLTLDHTVKAFCKFMETYRVRHAPVVDYPDGDKSSPVFIGIVSERDTLRLGMPRRRATDPVEIDPKATRQLLTQIVARKPKSVSPNASISEVIGLMARNRVDIVPILDRSGLVGIITTTDILRLTVKLSEVYESILKESKGKDVFGDLKSIHCDERQLIDSFAKSTVSDAMTANVVTMGPEDLLGDAKDLLRAHRLRHLPVLDEEGQLLGIISDRDILMQLPFAGKRPPKDHGRFREYLFKIDESSPCLQIPLERIMNREVLCVSPETNLSEAAMTMRRKKISCLVVVNGDRRLCGIITVVDIMRSLPGLNETDTVGPGNDAAGG